MSHIGLVDDLDHMHEAATLVAQYVAGLSQVQFLADKKTQQAVFFNLVVLGRSRDQTDEGAWPLYRSPRPDSLAGHQEHAQPPHARLLRH